MSTITPAKELPRVQEVPTPEVRAPESQLEAQALLGNGFLRDALASSGPALHDSWLGSPTLGVLEAQAPAVEPVSLFGDYAVAPRADGGEVHKAWAGLDQQAGGMRVQAGNVGAEVVFKGGGGPESFVGGDVHGTGMGVSADPASERRSGFWGGLKFLDGGANLRAGDPTFGEASYRADLVSGEVGFRGVNKDSASDRGLRVGVSFGAPNAGLRHYAQDLDNDGRTERGTGLTIPVGPFGVSLDTVSEVRLGDMGVEVGDLMANCLGLPPMATIENEAMMASGADQSLASQLNPVFCDALGVSE